jgi:hypothetical protein
MAEYKHWVGKSSSGRWYVWRDSVPAIVCSHSRWETAFECAFERARYARPSINDSRVAR